VEAIDWDLLLGIASAAFLGLLAVVAGSRIAAWFNRER
jgi:hypothetical protein